MQAHYIIQLMTAPSNKGYTPAQIRNVNRRFLEVSLLKRVGLVERIRYTVLHFVRSVRVARGIMGKEAVYKGEVREKNASIRIEEVKGAYKSCDGTVATHGCYVVKGAIMRYIYGTTHHTRLSNSSGGAITTHSQSLVSSNAATVIQNNYSI